MAVRTFVLNLDNPHLKACAPGERLDVAGDWRTRVTITPIDGQGFDADMFTGARARMEYLARFEAELIWQQREAGEIASGSSVCVPINFVFADPGSDPKLYKFDRLYGLRFPTAEEVAEEMERRELS